MSKVKNEIKIIKERIFSLLILSLFFLMLFTSLNVTMATNTANTSLAANIVNGTLDIAASPASFGWNNTTAGQASNQLNNVNNIQVTDYRGNTGGWSLTATANNLTAGTNVLNTFARVKVSPGTVTNINGSNITGVSDGSDNQVLGPSSGNAVNMMTATASNGAGAFQLDATLMNLTVQVSDIAGSYTATMILTVS
jgi:hypothetical protein